MHFDQTNCNLSEKIYTLVHKSEIHMYTCLCCWGGPGILDCVEYGCNLATVLMVDEEADSCSWIYQPKSGRDTTRKNICCLWIILDSSLCFSIFHTSSNIKYVCWGQTKFEYPYKNKMFHKLSLIWAFIFIEPRFSTPKKRWICKYLKIFCGPISNTSRFHFHTWWWCVQAREKLWRVCSSNWDWPGTIWGCKCHY